MRRVPAHWSSLMCCVCAQHDHAHGAQEVALCELAHQRVAVQAGEVYVQQQQSAFDVAVRRRGRRVRARRRRGGAWHGRGCRATRGAVLLSDDHQDRHVGMTVGINLFPFDVIVKRFPCCGRRSPPGPPRLLGDQPCAEHPHHPQGSPGAPSAVSARARGNRALGCGCPRIDMPSITVPSTPNSEC
jgi:hypothetical protein